MEQQKMSNDEEVDLSTIFNGFRRSYHNVLIWCYRGIRFVFKTWYFVLGLIIIGVLAGYIAKEDKQPQEATLIVQLNFDSANYIYSAIDRLNDKLSSNDTVFLKQAGFKTTNNRLLNSVEIEPIVNLNDLIPEDENNTTVGYLQTLFDKSKFKDDLLTSDILIPAYKKHSIQITSGPQIKSQRAIEALLTYLNDNNLVQRIKEVSIKNTENHIEENKKSIAHIDSIAKTFGKSSKTIQGTTSMKFNIQELNNSNMHMLFREKSKLLRKTEDLEIELLKYDKIVKLLNKPALHAPKKGIFSNKVIVYPIVLLILLFVGVQFRRLYYKAKRLSE